jgi:hypothetical protein
MMNIEVFSNLVINLTYYTSCPRRLTSGALLNNAIYSSKEYLSLKKKFLLYFATNPRGLIINEKIHYDYW